MCHADFTNKFVNIWGKVGRKLPNWYKKLATTTTSQKERRVNNENNSQNIIVFLYRYSVVIVINYHRNNCTKGNCMWSKTNWPSIDHSPLLWCCLAGSQRGRKRAAETRGADGRSSDVGVRGWSGGHGDHRGLGPGRYRRAGRVSSVDRPGDQLVVRTPSGAAAAPTTERQLGPHERRTGARPWQVRGRPRHSASTPPGRRHRQRNVAQPESDTTY